MASEACSTPTNAYPQRHANPMLKNAVSRIGPSVAPSPKLAWSQFMSRGLRLKAK